MDDISVIQEFLLSTGFMKVVLFINFTVIYSKYRFMFSK